MQGGGWSSGWSTCGARTWWCSGCRAVGCRSRPRWPRGLDAPLDVIVVRKLGVPFQPELAMGAVGEGGALVVNERGAAPGARHRGRVRRGGERGSARRSSGGRCGSGGTGRGWRWTGRTALVVDDGIATGSTARAACQVARAQGAARVVLAVPVCSPDTARALRGEVDELVCLETPRWFFAVGQCYTDFRPTSDDEVTALLGQAARRVPTAAAVGDRPASDERSRRVVDEEVEVTAGRARLAGHLTVPADARGVVVFAHGSGSSRHSPRNRYVADVLQQAGLARCCSTCSPRARSATAATCSTSTCWPAGSPR